VSKQNKAVNQSLSSIAKNQPADIQEITAEYANSIWLLP
jgi:hypothetical protein